MVLNPSRPVYYYKDAQRPWDNDETLSVYTALHRATTRIKKESPKEFVLKALMVSHNSTETEPNFRGPVNHTAEHSPEKRHVNRKGKLGECKAGAAIYYTGHHT